jgi:hypothetical protein
MKVSGNAGLFRFCSFLQASGRVVACLRPSAKMTQKAQKCCTNVLRMFYRKVFEDFFLWFHLVFVSLQRIPIGTHHC